MNKWLTFYIEQMFSGHKKEKDKLNNDETVPYLNVNVYCCMTD